MVAAPDTSGGCRYGRSEISAEELVEAAHQLIGDD